jgi:hypothetical protein
MRLAWRAFHGRRGAGEAWTKLEERPSQEPVNRFSRKASTDSRRRAGNNAGQFQSPDWAASALWLAIFDAKAQRRKEIEESESGTQELKKKQESWPFLKNCVPEFMSSRFIRFS